MHVTSVKKDLLQLSWLIQGMQVLSKVDVRMVSSYQKGEVYKQSRMQYTDRK